MLLLLVISALQVCDSSPRSSWRRPAAELLEKIGVWGGGKASDGDDDDDDDCKCDECDDGDELIRMTVADDKW